MTFIRHQEPLDSLHIGKRVNLPIVSSVNFELIDDSLWEKSLIRRNLSSEKTGELLGRLETGKIGKKFIFEFFYNIDRIKLEKAKKVEMEFLIKAENVKNDLYGLTYGEFVYEHDDRIYNIPEEVELVDDLFWGSKFWGFSTLGHEIRKARNRFR